MVVTGKTGQFVATAKYSDNSTKDISTQATWSSSDSAIASVRLGLVAGLFPGTVSIKAQFSDATAAANVSIASPFSAGIVFGSGVSATDQALVRQAQSINESFWGPLGVTVLAFSSIAEVTSAYTALCGCPVPSNVPAELSGEAMSTAPGVILVAIDSLHSLDHQLERLVHEEFHAVQKGFTGGFVGPVWLAEGSAVYTQIHAMGRAGLLNTDSSDQSERRAAASYPTALGDLEQWPSDALGCVLSGACSAYYTLGHVATDFLVAKSGQSSVLAYWRETGANIRRGMSQDDAWRAAFNSVVAESVAQFYVEFGAYRDTGFR